MSGHEAHGHGDHGHESHGPQKIVRPEITDQYIEEVNSRLNMADEEAEIRRSIASGKLSPQIEREAHAILTDNQKKRAGALYEKERAIRVVNQLIEDRESKTKRIDDLEDSLRETTSIKLRESIRSKIDIELENLRKINEKLEKNQENTIDAELTKQLDKTRSEYAKEFKKYHKGIKTEKRIENLKIGIFNTGTKIKNLFRKEGNKKDLLEKKSSSEYETPEFRTKREAYDVARLALANRMYERKEKELMYVGSKTREAAILEIKKNNPAPAQHVETRDEAIVALKIAKTPVFKLKTKEVVLSEMGREIPSVFASRSKEEILKQIKVEETPTFAPKTKEVEIAKMKIESPSVFASRSKEEILKQIKAEKTPSFTPKTRDQTISEMKRESPSIFVKKTRDAVIVEMLSEYEAEAESRGYPKAEIQEQLIDQEERFRFGKYDDEIDSRIEKELEEYIVSGKYDPEIQDRIQKDLQEQKDAFDTQFESDAEAGKYDSKISAITKKEIEEDIASGKYDTIIQDRIQKDLQAQKNAFDTQFESDAEAGKYDSNVSTIIKKEIDADIASGMYDTIIQDRIQNDLHDQKNAFEIKFKLDADTGKFDKEIEKRIKDSEASAKEAKGKFESNLEAEIKNGVHDPEIDRIRLESGKMDPLEQIKKLKQYKAKEILQKTFFDERRKVYEESGVPEKTAALRLWHWYAKQPRLKKIALSTALFTAGGAMGAIPFAAGMIAKYGVLSYAGMRFGTSALIGGTVANGVKGIDMLNYKKDEDFRKEQERKRKESEEKFLNGEINQKKHEENLLFIEEDENNAKKKRMRAKAVVGVLLGAGVGAGAYHLIGGIMPADHEHVPPPTTKGVHITKDPETILTTPPKAEVIPEPAPTPEPPAQINPENGQEYTPSRIPPREPAGPEIDMNPNRAALERGGANFTSDFTPHTTADGVGPANPQAADQASSVVKPKYNMGDIDPNKKISPVNPENNTTTKYPGLDKMLDEADKNRDPFNGKYVSDAEHFRGTGSGSDMDYKDAVKSAYDNARARLLAETNNNTELVKSAKVISTHYKELPGGGYKVDVAMSIDKPVVVGGGASPENVKLSDQINPETNKPMGSPENTKAPKVETPDANAGKQVNPETNKPMGSNYDTEALQNNEGPQTVGEFIKGLNKQSPYNAEEFKTRGNMSDQEIKNILTPSDSNHERIVIKGESSSIVTATKSIDFSKSQLKNNMEDFKQITEMKQYQDEKGYHLYQIVEVKK